MKPKRDHDEGAARARAQPHSVETAGAESVSGTRDDNVSMPEEIMIEAARSPTMLLLVFTAWLLLSLLPMPSQGELRKWRYDRREPVYF